MNDLDKKRDEWILQEYGTGHDRESHFVIDTAKNGWSAAVKECGETVELQESRIRNIKDDMIALKNQIKDYEACLKAYADPRNWSKMGHGAYAIMFTDAKSVLDKYSKKEGE